MSRRNRCVNCNRFFRPNPRVEEQRYCSRKGCQRVRKSRWQREKMTRDPDYKANQKRAQSDWVAGKPDYWRKYREDHPEYAARNRLLQKKRDAERRKCNLAKMDALEGENHIETGTYYLVPSLPENLAKMDALGQKVRIISDGCTDSGPILQRRTRSTPSVDPP